MHGLDWSCVLIATLFLQANGIRDGKDEKKRSFRSSQQVRHPLDAGVGNASIELLNAPSLTDTNSLAKVLYDPGEEVSLQDDMVDLPFSSDLFETNASIPTNVTMSLASARLSNKQKPLLWIHIHKAAGTFMCMMAKRAGERIVRPQSNCNSAGPAGHDRYKDVGHRERAVTCARRKKIFTQFGFTWGAIERELWPSDHCWNHFDYGIMLRQPLDLIHSYLNYNLKFHGGNGRASMKELERRLKWPPRLRKRLWIRAPARFPEWLFLDNIMTRLLTNSMEVPAGGLKVQHVVKAKQILEHFKVVAVLEELPSTGHEIFQTLGWPKEMASQIKEKKLHVARDRLHFTAAETKWLRYVNRHDIRLYNSFVGKRNTSSSLKSFARPHHL